MQGRIGQPNRCEGPRCKKKNWEGYRGSRRLRTFSKVLVKPPMHVGEDPFTVGVGEVLVSRKKMACREQRKTRTGAEFPPALKKEGARHVRKSRTKLPGKGRGGQKRMSP